MNFHQKPVTHVAEVGLKVLDLTEMIRFYTETIGLSVLSRTEKKAVLGVAGRELLVLEATEGLTPKRGRYAGLYHFAILLPNRKELGKILLHLHYRGIELGSSDHLVSEALYLSDPEGNGIEIYRDRDASEWNWNNGEIAMAVDPLDAEEIVKVAEESGETWQGMPAGTVMGHIHLHVSDLSQAKDFYVDGLGFGVVASMGRQALFIADQSYHHHIGLNVWNGMGVPMLPEKTAGLGYYTLNFDTEETRSAIAAQLREIGADVVERENYLETRDPAGNAIRLAV
ncbi:VOC family protein [Planomicrobium sp. CPCC 101079]|uniref:VOC family protein n=1 Tax=Planomicrobium sp. CPCC 101079 TaxID=2599618 RepID=UPI0011B53B76|nr:VOC family protein [Planomicrobium sp. CPCC 101079]TWT02328.1 VOC family protein [Planomicrobium sp. CPCC 101079]